MEAGDSPAEFVSLSKTFIAWDLVDFIPALLAGLVIWRITKRQEERRRRFERGELDLGEAPSPAQERPEPSPIPTGAPPPQTLGERLTRPDLSPALTGTHCLRWRSASRP